MLFNTIEYIIFFFVVVVLYFLLSHKYRWILLLAASYYFYMNWKLEYIVLIIASTLVDYFATIQIAKLKEKKKKIKYVYLSILANIGILFTFKYYNFFIDQVNEIFIFAGADKPFLYLDVLLPVGISFYTFQTLGYTIDVYNGKIQPQRHLGKFALFVSFFPQLVAGPIERAKNLLPQFDKKLSYDYDRIRYGLLQMAWGFFKKMVIADRLAIFVDQFYASPADHTGMDSIVAMFFFAIQLYCDFSGYSDIAIGSARVMGFDLMENFKRPFFADSLSRLWRRWHISLTTWFKDYIYIPLNSGKSLKIKSINLFIVFAISGLWHGAGYNFIICFLIQALVIFIGRISRDKRDDFFEKAFGQKFVSVRHLFQVFFTFTIFAVSFVFFRASTNIDAIDTYINLFEFDNYHLTLATDQYNFIAALIAIIILFIIDFFQERINIFKFVMNRPIVIRWSIYFITASTIFYFGVFDYKEFIYFQF